MEEIKLTHGISTPPMTLALNETHRVQGVIGHVRCINIARAGEPEQLRYVGYAGREQGKGPTGQALLTVAEAEQNVRDWYEGKPVAYPMHAIVPLGVVLTASRRSKGGAALCFSEIPELSKEEAITAFKNAPLVFYSPEPKHNNFTIGPGNTWAQAWEAMLAGHRVQLPAWDMAAASWLYENNTGEIIVVRGDTPEDWLSSAQSIIAVTAGYMLKTDWIVLPKIHPEPPTI